METGERMGLPVNYRNSDRGNPWSVTSNLMAPVTGSVKILHGGRHT